MPSLVIAPVSITSIRVDFVLFDFNNTNASIGVSFLDVAGNIIEKKFFIIKGATYTQIIGKNVRGVLATIVIGEITTFASSIMTNPAMGTDIVEISSGLLMTFGA